MSILNFDQRYKSTTKIIHTAHEMLVLYLSYKRDLNICNSKADFDISY